MGDDGAAQALEPFDRLYPQANGESPLQQLQIQLANPLPYDLDDIALGEYKNLDPRWWDWETVKSACSHLATYIFDRVSERDADGSASHEVAPGPESA